MNVSKLALNVASGTMAAEPGCCLDVGSSAKMRGMACSAGNWAAMAWRGEVVAAALLLLLLLLSMLANKHKRPAWK